MKNHPYSALVAGALVASLSIHPAHAQTAGSLGASLEQAELTHRLKLADERRQVEAEQVAAEKAEMEAKKLEALKRVAEAKRDKERAERGEDTYAPTARPMSSSYSSMPPPPMFQGSAQGGPVEVPPQRTSRPSKPVEPPLPALQAIVGSHARMSAMGGPVSSVTVGGMIGEHKLVSISPSSVQVDWKGKTSTIALDIR